MSNLILQQLAQECVERVQSFLASHNLECEVILLITSRFDPRNVIGAYTCDNEALNLSLSSAITDERVTDDI